MTSARGTMATTFPTERNGYSPVAVDAFVQEMGARFDEVQRDLDDRVVRAAQTEQELARLKATVASYTEKEAAIAAVLVGIEQQKAANAKDMEAQLAKAREEAEHILADARLEGLGIAARAQADAEEKAAQASRDLAEMEASARAAREAEEQRLKALQAQYAATVAAMRTELSTLLAFLPDAEAADAPSPVLALASA